MAGSGNAHLSDDALLRVTDLVVEFDVAGGTVHAVSGLSLDIGPRETLGLVGESGSGKSSTGRAILQLPPPRAGTVELDGAVLTELRGEQLRRQRRHLQMIFQDPRSSLNPRRSVREIVREPLRIWHDARDARDDRTVVDEALDAVGLDPAQVAERRPHELSGGQCQRVSIARALVLRPSLLVCDEPVASLDVSVQAQILNLLEDIKERYGLAMLFIAHDLAVVKNISDRVAVMYLGKLCEIAPSDALYARPMHPYTNALLAAIPVADPTRRPDASSLSGELPSPLDPPSGCRFRTRCPLAQQVCADTEPQVRELAPGHHVACHFPVLDR